MPSLGCRPTGARVAAASWAPIDSMSRSTPLSRLPSLEISRSEESGAHILKKICKRYGIPTPARGHWAQVAAGNAPPKPGLPPAKIDTVVLEAVRHRINTPPSARDAVDIGIVRRAISAPDKPDTPIAAATAEALAKAKPSPEGFVQCGSSRAIRCLLSPTTIERKRSARSSQGGRVLP